MTESQFAALCKAHDLTYMYSDDHGVWQRGTVSMATIREVRDALPHEVAVRIWNSAVDEKIADPEFRKQFYWIP